MAYFVSLSKKKKPGSKGKLRRKILYLTGDATLRDENRAQALSVRFIRVNA
jgi:hypothetical protein